MRQLQGWAFTSIIEEFRRFASVDVRVQPSVEHFIERFDVDLVTLPRDLPSWMVIQQNMLQVEEKEARSSAGNNSSSGTLNPLLISACGPLRSD